MQKENFLGVYHKINGEYLQKYLNEFVYKLKRRYLKSIFDRLVVASFILTGKLKSKQLKLLPFPETKQLTYLLIKIKRLFLY